MKKVKITYCLTEVIEMHDSEDETIAIDLFHKNHKEDGLEILNIEEEK